MLTHRLGIYFFGMILRLIFIEAKLFTVAVYIHQNMIVLMPFKPSFLPIISEYLTLRINFWMMVYICQVFRRAVSEGRVHNKRMRTNLTQHNFLFIPIK